MKEFDSQWCKMCVSSNIVTDDKQKEILHILMMLDVCCLDVLWKGYKKADIGLI